MSKIPEGARDPDAVIKLNEEIERQADQYAMGYVALVRGESVEVSSVIARSLMRAGASTAQPETLFTCCGPRWAVARQ